MKTNLILMLFLVVYYSGLAQESEGYLLQDEEVYATRKNIPKFIPTSLVVGNFQFQYERVLNKTFSAAIGYSMIPEGDFPFKDKILDEVSDEDDVGRYINNATLQYSSFTPEVRIYIGEGYGKGFYLAPFYRHSKYTVKDVEVYFEADDGGERRLDTDGELTTDTFGLLVGVQFNLGSRIVLDWFILGPNYGFSNGNLVGVADQSLSQSEQQSLREELEIVEDLPFGDFQYDVDSQGGEVKIDGPWGGIRAGLAIGFRF